MREWVQAKLRRRLHPLCLKQPDTRKPFGPTSAPLRGRLRRRPVAIVHDLDGAVGIRAQEAVRAQTRLSWG